MSGFSAEEVFDSLTGFDEIAISQHFGRTVSELGEKDQSMFGRALVFVLKRRDGASDDEARNAALGLTMKEFTAFFAEPSEDEAGKDEAPEEQPESSLSSVS
jgi:hypothetical protein